MRESEAWSVLLAVHTGNLRARATRVCELDGLNDPVFSPSWKPFHHGVPGRCVASSVGWSAGRCSRLGLGGATARF